MKKLLFTIFIAFTLLLTTGCTGEIPAFEQQQQERTVSVSATLPSTTETRTAFYSPTWTAATGYGFKMKWVAGDRFSILCWQGADVANWGKLINTTNDNQGRIIEKDNGEIIYTLKSSDISADGRTMNFNFAIPKQITDNTQSVKVLVTHLGKGGYYYYNTITVSDGYGNKPWLHMNYSGVIKDESDAKNLNYITNVLPLTLRGQIASGWASTASPKASFDKQFKHLAALFALQIKNNTSGNIDPKKISIFFDNGRVMLTKSYPDWNPIAPEIPFTTPLAKVSVENEYRRAISPGKSFVYFLPIFFTETPSTIIASYLDNSSTTVNELITNYRKTTSLTIQPGKCYTVNLQVNSITNTGTFKDFVWGPDTPTQAPWE